MTAPAAISWPSIGSTWVDATGRTLHVTDVQPGSRLGRHVIGTINREAYACDLPTFDAVWRERRVAEESEFQRPRQQYVGGKPSGRAR